MEASATTTPATPCLVEQREGPVARLILNRPEQRNSLSETLITALEEALAALGRDDTVRVIILEACGPAFCAGHDLKEMTAHRQDNDRGRTYYERIMSQCSSMMQKIVTCPKPVIARVHGIATAAGCQLVASCDLAIAADTARFATPGVNIGLFCSTPMVALSRNIPRKRAMEMLLLGEMMDARTAADYGLINKSVPPDSLDDAVNHMAGTIAQKSALTVQIGKEAFYRQLEQPLSEAYAYASQIMVTNMLAHDAQEGIGAFLEKRDPLWQNK
ncbi:MAG: enoyl-CoA hydratase [Parvularculales bacterium]